MLLDNFEHLLAGVDLVADIVATAPDVKLLVTSREALTLQEEWFHPIVGLSFPNRNSMHDEVISDYDAVQLFAQSARRASVGFALSEALAHVIRICQLVDGMPLAIELAAAWLKVLPCAQVASELERTMDLLTARHKNVPERHRSMRVVLEQSWQLLSDEEQDVLRRLAVFRGGFRQEAAEAVAHTSLLLLATLVEKSLLRVAPDGRYQIHELLHQFAAEKLTEVSQEEAVTCERHSIYFLGFLQAREPMLNGKEQKQGLDEIDEEIDNIRTGWEWAIAQDNLKAIREAMDGLYLFYDIRSRFQEGEGVFANTIAQLSHTEIDDTDSAFMILLGKLQARRGAFCFSLGDYERANEYIQASINVGGEPDDTAFTYCILGQMSAEQGERSAAEMYLHKSLTIAQQLNDLDTLADAKDAMAGMYSNFAEHAKAVRFARGALAMRRRQGRPDRIAQALGRLAYPTTCLGKYSEAETYWLERLAICQEIGNLSGIAGSLEYLGWATWGRGEGNYTEILARYDRALVIYKEIGRAYNVSMVLADLALAWVELAEYTKAQEAAHEGLAAAQQINSLDQISLNLCYLGAAAAGLGDFQVSRQYLVRVLQTVQDIQMVDNMLAAIFFLTKLLLRESESKGMKESTKQGEMTRAAELLALVIHHPSTLHPYKERAVALLTTLESKLADDVVQAAIARGRSRSVQDVVTEILNDSFR